MLGLALICMSARPAQNDATTKVLTALPVTYSITANLARGTSIKVVNVPEEARPMSALGRYLEKPDAKLNELLGAADAVVTIGKVWREDPLYAAVRNSNIRVVNIDATEPYSTTLAGVSLMAQPDDRAPWEQSSAASAGRPELHFWLSPANGARMADIVAHDLMRLSPADAAPIEKNLVELRRKLLALKATYEAKLAALDNVTVFALTSDFSYLCGDVGIFVDGYFVKQDIDWTSDDLRHLREHLQERGIRVVLHKWEPSQAIQEAVRAAGATMLVLKNGDEGAPAGQRLAEDVYPLNLEANLQSLYQALAAANRSGR